MNNESDAFCVCTICKGGGGLTQHKCYFHIAMDLFCQKENNDYLKRHQKKYVEVWFLSTGKKLFSLHLKQYYSLYSDVLKMQIFPLFCRMWHKFWHKIKKKDSTKEALKIQFHTMEYAHKVKELIIGHVLLHGWRKKQMIKNNTTSKIWSLFWIF